MSRHFDYQNNNYKPEDYSSAFRDIKDYKDNKRRSSVIYVITIATFFVALASLIVGLIALFLV